MVTGGNLNMGLNLATQFEMFIQQGVTDMVDIKKPTAKGWPL